MGDRLDTNWLGLRVQECVTDSASTASVEFVAFFLENRRVEQLRERSRFERLDGQWLYLDGQFLAPLKLSRNDPCCCGSGKKQKKCHPEF